MVITIQNHNAGLDLSEFTCNNLNLFIDLRDATRSVLASLLTTVWGVVPTYPFLLSLFFSNFFL